MATVNNNYLKLEDGYLFSVINKKQKAFMAKNPSAKLIKLGEGDVSKPLVPPIIEAMKKAVEELGNEETFKGYPPERGYPFLIDAIIKNDYFGLNINEDEVFISDGGKADTGNISEIFGLSDVVAVCDPVYPVYVDSNVIMGRSGELKNGRYEKIVYMNANADNGFIPLPNDGFKADLIYLCYPNNPTGTVITKEKLKKWVDYANNNNAVILYDGAYEGYIREENIPHSIYEIEGAKTCAIEFRSFSKNAGFTGVRCSFTIVPKELKLKGVSVNGLWARRQSTKLNGVSYITQRGAEAAYTKESKELITKQIDYYLNNANIMMKELNNGGFEVYGGKNSPYVWMKIPNNMTSWEYFDYLLENKQVVCTPGVGFGIGGEGFVRLSAFSSLEDTKEGIKRIIKESFWLSFYFEINE